MKMLGKAMCAIVLVGMVLLIQTADATRKAKSRKTNGVAKDTGAITEFVSLHDFCATASNRPSMAQTQELLKRAKPNEKIGSVSAGEMLRMDEISMFYCNWRELDNRNEFCYEKEIGDEDLRRYCDVRFNELVKFCADNLDKVARKEIDQRLFVELYDLYDEEARDFVKKLDKIREQLGKYFEEDGDFYDELGEDCGEFHSQFETVKAIVEFSGLDFMQMAKDKGLVKYYEVREFCKFVNAKYGGSDSAPKMDGV